MTTFGSAKWQGGFKETTMPTATIEYRSLGKSDKLSDNGKQLLGRCSYFAR